jgi:hypothetical protein
VSEPARSGLRNPAAAVRGAGAGALGAMGLVLLLAIVPLIRLGVGSGAVVLVVGLAVAAFTLCGLLRHPWAWYAAMVVPAALIAAGGWHIALAIVGVLFGLLWAYILHVRRTVLGPSAAVPTGSGRSRVRPDHGMSPPTAPDDRLD